MATEPGLIGMTAVSIRVKGIVQGVGFRPFVYSLAQRNHLTGWVRNTSGGVEIWVEGHASAVEDFSNTLRNSPPPLAVIDDIAFSSESQHGYAQFEILTSQPQPGQFLPISPDIATCPDCRRELFDPHDRRYRYPFTNCTNCGPRFTIIKDIPYDRPKTTMADFPLCPDCAAEYADPSNRRFHAQPVACPVCGPKVWLEQPSMPDVFGDDAIRLTRQMIKDGKIVAIKGLGGYLLACDATNPQAVETLRRRKKRSDKPFALMAFSLEDIRTFAEVNLAEETQLTSPQAPIVLLKKKPECTLASQVASGQRTVGFMLPYTPLHWLLLEPAAGFPQALVMTSGNRSEEPIAYQDEEARQRLGDIADAFLMNDRPVHMRTDDSVMNLALNRPYFFRRARGYAPQPLNLPIEVPSILAAGAELKNTFCLTRQSYAFLSHHIGDLENLETLQSFEEGIAHYQNLFRIQPELIACDIHPDYLATRYAHTKAESENLPLIEVQHHHAHLAAVLADNGWDTDEPVIGLSFDGTGMGTDGAIWGGEVLVGGYKEYQRMYHLDYIPLPGGDLSVHKPARMALAHLWKSGLDWEADLPVCEAICYEERLAMRLQMEKSLNSPPTSSMGRLFDAAAALIGIRDVATYEGQAAIEMEALVKEDETGYYTFQINDSGIDATPVWKDMLRDWRNGVTIPMLSARFHNSIVELCRQLCLSVKQTSGCSTVALSGGVWQNRYLLEHTIPV
ncbi:MAG TPA: carbamoyltransferase HypF, partial [Longilinea sp.]|nr:carbamoyltransferase HypF [Longilinea sp.]